MQNYDFTPRERLSIGNAADYLGVSIDTLRRWERKKRITAFRSPGGHRYFFKKELDELFGVKYTRDEQTIRESYKQEPILTTGLVPNSPIHQFAHDVPPPAPVLLDTNHEQINNTRQNQNQDIPYREVLNTISLDEQSPPSPPLDYVRSNENKLTDRQKELLKGIIKNEKQKSNRPQRIFKIIIILTIILILASITIFYFWFYSPVIISPIP